MQRALGRLIAAITIVCLSSAGAAATDKLAFSASATDAGKSSPAPIPFMAQPDTLVVALEDDVALTAIDDLAADLGLWVEKYAPLSHAAALHVPDAVDAAPC